MTTDLTKPVQTRDGRPARVVFTDRKSPPTCGYAVAGALVETTRGEENFYWYNEDGTRWAAKGPVPTDLVNVPVKTSTWQTIYEHNMAGGVYRTLEDALRLSGTNRVGFLRRDFEDGKFIGVEFEKI